MDRREPASDTMRTCLTIQRPLAQHQSLKPNLAPLQFEGIVFSKYASDQ